jgi:hypothetical protein
MQPATARSNVVRLAAEARWFRGVNMIARSGTPHPPDFEIEADLWVDSDPADPTGRRAKGLRHLTEPLPRQPIEATPRELALLYIRAVGAGRFDVTPAQLDLLGRRASRDGPSPVPPFPGHWLRWLPERSFAPGGSTETVTVAVQQTVQAEGAPEVDIPGNGLRILMRRVAPGTRDGGPGLQVLAAQAELLPPGTQLPSLEAGAPSFAEDLRSEEGRARLVARLLGLPRSAIAPGNAGRLIRIPPDEAAGEPVTIGGEIEFLLRRAEAKGWRRDTPAVPHRLVLDFRGAGGSAPRRRNLETLVANCVPQGHVFRLDPASLNGDPQLRPDLPASILDRYRESVDLTDLEPPGADGAQALRGRFVAIMGAGADANPLGVAPPTVAPPFDFSARSDDFAAVSAYHHCTCALRLAHAFGCTAPGYFAAEQFPIPVAHRGAIVLRQPDTDLVPYVDQQVFTINAQVVRDTRMPGTVPGRVREIRFALGDLSDAKTLPVLHRAGAAPGALGSGTDRRWTLHEMGHVLLAAATGALQLPFAHSIGDALAAILCDPESAYAERAWNIGGRSMRGVTFPWIDAPLRRHDRRPERGWAWHGTMNQGAYPPAEDPNGYWAEQILSSTLFRLYLSAGGDAEQPDGRPDIPRRRRAANYVCYLVMHALQGLGPVEERPLPVPLEAGAGLATPEAFVTCLMAVDAQTSEFTLDGDTRLGGALLKPIREAFELQGLYPRAGDRKPWNGPGAPPPVDLYLEDEEGRAGTYRHTERWHAAAGAVRLEAPDGAPGPVPGGPHLIHLQVGNRGTTPAADIGARAWATGPGADPDIWDPAAWVRLDPLVVNAPGPLPPGDFATLPPFTWTPQGTGTQAVLVEVAAPGDRSLLHEPSALRCATGPTPLRDLVPFDNNLGYRSWAL